MFSSNVQQSKVKGFPMADLDEESLLCSERLNLLQTLASHNTIGLDPNTCVIHCVKFYILTELKSKV